MTVASMSGPFYAVRDDLHEQVEIGGEFYRLLYVDDGFVHPEDRGLYRAIRVTQDQFGRWSAADDDDYMIDPASFQIVAREFDWCKRREKM